MLTPTQKKDKMLDIDMLFGQHKQSNSQLPLKDAKRCIRLFDQLDVFALKKFNIRQKGPMNLSTRYAVRRKWQAEPDFISEFLNCNNLSPEDRHCIATWDTKVSGKYILLKYYPTFAALRSFETDQLYGVKALTDDFKDMLPLQLPLLLEVVLYPYRDVIIWDGLTTTHNLTIGENVKRLFIAEADQAVKKNTIITQLTDL